jgi:uncharacterized membrane protein YqjE
MTQPDHPLFRDLQEQLAGMAGDAREMLALRWSLARLELRADACTLRRLAIKLAISGVMALTALPLLLAAAAVGLHHWTRIPTGTWLALFALLLLAAAGAIGCLAWRRFRRQFTGMAETLEELREDLEWLKEWRDGRMNRPQ